MRSTGATSSTVALMDYLLVNGAGRYSTVASHVRSVTCEIRSWTRRPRAAARRGDRDDERPQRMRERRIQGESACTSRTLFPSVPRHRAASVPVLVVTANEPPVECECPRPEPLRLRLGGS